MKKKVRIRYFEFFVINYFEVVAFYLYNCLQKEFTNHILTIYDCLYKLFMFGYFFPLLRCRFVPETVPSRSSGSKSVPQLSIG